MLRAEAMAIDARELRCGRMIEQFDAAVRKLKEVLEHFLEVLSCLDSCFISEEQMEQLTTPSRVGEWRIGGIDLQQRRTDLVLKSLLALSVEPRGFRVSQLAAPTVLFRLPLAGSVDLQTRRVDHHVNRLAAPHSGRGE